MPQAGVKITILTMLLTFIGLTLEGISFLSDKLSPTTAPRVYWLIQKPNPRPLSGFSNHKQDHEVNIATSFSFPLLFISEQAKLKLTPKLWHPFLHPWKYPVILTDPFLPSGSVLLYINMSSLTYYTVSKYKIYQQHVYIYFGKYTIIISPITFSIW